MTRPDALATHAPLPWSPGSGADVWAMLQAAESGDVAAVTRLLDREPSLVRAQYAYRTPLSFAVRENQVAVVRLLLERGADPFASWAPDPLHVIARERGYTELQALLEARLAAMGVSAGDNPVAEAIRARDFDLVRRLLDASPDLLHQGDERSNQPIHWAVMTRQPAMIDELLARGADLEARRADGARPIHLTNGDYTYRGWRDVPRETVEKPGDILAHLRSRGAHVDLNTACHTGDIDRVRELLAEDPTRANRLSDYVTYYLGSGSPLRNAASNGHLDVVQLLLAHGANPNLSEEGIAPQGHALYSAVYNGHREIARRLLEHGAFPNPEVESSADALGIALSNNDEALVELLCSYGAWRKVHLLAYSGDVRTAAAVFAVDAGRANDPEAFAHAAEEGHESFVRLMLRYRPDLATRVSVAGKTRALTEYLFARGMDPSRPDWLGITPLHRFAARGDLANAALFLAHGADVDARDRELRSTPLGYAARAGAGEMVTLLLEQGARAEHPDDPPWATPVAWARRRGHDDVLRRLGSEHVA